MKSYRELLEEILNNNHNDIIHEEKKVYIFFVAEEGGTEWGDVIKIRKEEPTLDDVKKEVVKKLKKIDPLMYYDAEYLAQKFEGDIKDATDYIYETDLETFTTYTEDDEYSFTFTLKGGDVWSKSQIKQALKKTSYFN